MNDANQSTLARAQGLVIAHQLFHEGESLARLEGTIHALRAVLFLDLSVEHVLNMILLAHDGPMDRSDGRKEVKFASLLQTASGVYRSSTKKKRFPQADNLQLLHDLRNLAQHNGSAPRTVELLGYVPIVRHFHQAIYQDLFGVDFDTLAIWDFLPNPELISYMRECSELSGEDAIGREAATRGCWTLYSQLTTILRRGATYHHGRFYERGSLSAIRDLGRGDHRGGWDGGGRSSWELRDVAAHVDQVKQEVARELDELRGELLLASLGMPLAETRRFVEQAQPFARYFPSEDVGNADLIDVKPVLGYMSKLLYLCSESFPNYVKRLSLSDHRSPKELAEAMRQRRVYPPE